MLKPVEGAPLLHAVAAHESAHVVLCHYFGYRVESVYAFTDGGINGERGKVEFNDGPRVDGDAWKSERPEDMACVFLAGTVAQRLITGAEFSWDNCAVDLAHVEERASGRRQYYRLARRTIRIVDRLWPWIVELAEQLLRSRHMDQSQIGAILRGCPVQPRGGLVS